MRFYGFGNYYLSSLQQGLQAGHCVGELFAQYRNDKDKSDMTYEWAKNHKTMVLLNGGNSLSLQNLFEEFKVLQGMGMNLPFVKFHEDEQSLGGALTYVGMIVSSEVYELAAFLRDNPATEESYDFKHQLALKLNRYPLAK